MIYRARLLALVTCPLALVTFLSAQTISYNPGDNRTDADVLTGSTTLQVNGTGAQIATQSGGLSGDGSVIKTGAGTLSLTGENTYTGGTTIQEGEILIGAYPGGGTTGSILGPIVLDPGTAINFRRSDASGFVGNITYSGNPEDGDPLSARDGTVDINAAGTSFTLDGSVAVRHFYFNDGGTLNLTAGSSISAPERMLLGGGNANTTVNLADGASLVGWDIRVGDFSSHSATLSTTTLNIAAGATVDLSTNYSYIAFGGYNNAGTAELNVGTGATLTLSAPQFGGHGSANVEGLNGSTATVNLAAGSTLELTDTYYLRIGGSAILNWGDIILKGDGGDAIINVNDATLTMDDARIFLGGQGSAAHHGGDGTLNLDGAGTTLNLNVTPYEWNSSELYVGGGNLNAGNGTITITNGATLNVGETYVGYGAGTGTISVSGSGSTLNVGNSDAGRRLHLGANSYTDSNTDAGDHGANGSLSLSNGATAVVHGELSIGGNGSSDSEYGAFNGGNGTLNLASGAGLTAKANLIVGGQGNDADGDGPLGQGGTGTVNIASGATLNFEQTLYIGGSGGAWGETPSGLGTVNLGAGTLSGIGGQAIVISSTGTLNLGHDGTSATAAPTLTLDPIEGYIENYGTVNFRHTSGTLTINAVLYNDVEVETGVLTQSGTGHTVLTGDNSDFTGATTVSAGTLTIQDKFASDVTVESGGTFVLGSTGTFTGDLTLGSGAQFDNNGTFAAALSLGDGQILGGDGTFSGLVTLESGAILAPGNSPGTLTFTGGLTLDGGSLINFELGANTAASDLILVTGGNLTGPTSGLVTFNFNDVGGFAPDVTYSLIDGSSASALINFDAADFVGTGINGYTFNFALNGNILQMTAAVSAIPEPGTYAAIFGMAVLGFATCRRRRKA